jgi:hypothetical protein
MAIVEKIDEIRNSFVNSDSFIPLYFEAYVSALDNYRSIVGDSIRQISVEESSIFYPHEMSIYTSKELVSNEENKKTMMNYLDIIKNNHSCVIILRDEIAFVVIHHELDNYIIIDPHVEYTGILSRSGVYRYIVYDSVWDFDVHVLIPKVLKQEKMVGESDASSSVNDPVSDNSVNDPVSDNSVNDPVSDNSVNDPVSSSSVNESVSDNSVNGSILSDPDDNCVNDAVSDNSVSENNFGKKIIECFDKAMLFRNETVNPLNQSISANSDNESVADDFSNSTNSTNPNQNV